MKIENIFINQMQPTLSFTWHCLQLRLDPFIHLMLPSALTLSFTWHWLSFSPSFLLSNLYFVAVHPLSNKLSSHQCIVGIREVLFPNLILPHFQNDDPFCVLQLLIVWFCLFKLWRNLWLFTNYMFLFSNVKKHFQLILDFVFSNFIQVNFSM